MTAARPRRPVVRLPHWLGGDVRIQLTEALATALTDEDLHPVRAVYLHEALTELKVASARDVVWPESGQRVRRATGLPRDAVAVRLSPAELASVLGIDGLPAPVRSVLTRG